MASNGKNGKKSRKWIWMAVGVLALAGAAVGVRAALKPSKDIDPSKLASIEKGSIAKSVVATGKIEPRSTVEVKSKASGIVKKLYVDYGDFVKQGQVLAELDKEELQARLRESKANVCLGVGAVTSSVICSMPGARAIPSSVKSVICVSSDTASSPVATASRIPCDPCFARIAASISNSTRSPSASPIAPDRAAARGAIARLNAEIRGEDGDE